MLNLVQNFFSNEDGAVTVDWVVLTAAVVGMVFAAYASIQSSSSSMAGAAGTFLTETPLEDLRIGQK